MTTRAPEPNGSCKTTGGQVQSYTYDAGDRLVGPGPESIGYDSFGRITALPAKFSGGSDLTTSYYSNNMVAGPIPREIGNGYQLDAMGRVRERTHTGGGIPTEVFHYSMTSDAVAWYNRESSWARNMSGIGGGLAAIQQSSGEISLQLTNLHGDVVATAGISTAETKPTANYEFDEFGRVTKGGFGRYGWLGGEQRRTELASGVTQMGVRSYVPTSAIPFAGPRGGRLLGMPTTMRTAIRSTVFDLTGERAKIGLSGMKWLFDRHQHRQ